jgi:DNA polymerase-3 subunit chi
MSCLEQVGFYHLGRGDVLTTLPPLVDKIYSMGFKSHIYHIERPFLEELDRVLWTYTPLSFIPHCLDCDHLEPAQVVLSDSLIFSNNPTVFIGLSPYDPENIDIPIKRIVDMFEDRDELQIENARNRWKFFKNRGLKCTYWTQSKEGKWDKTAESAAN